jgi:hypothetical protein
MVPVCPWPRNIQGIHQVRVCIEKLQLLESLFFFRRQEGSQHS